jgi:hypothetical protein
MKDEAGRSTRGARFVSASGFHPRADILHPAPPGSHEHPTNLTTLPICSCDFR